MDAWLELSAFSTFDAMASTLRKEVDAEICGGIHDRMSARERAGLLRLLAERESDGTTLYNRLKKPQERAAGKITDFAGDADAPTWRSCGTTSPSSAS